MQKRNVPRLVCLSAVGVLFILSVGLNLALISAGPHAPPERRAASPPVRVDAAAKEGDEQLAYLLVKLELATRGEILGHFTRKQSPVPGVDKFYQRLMVKNLILPAGVADRVFSETVPNATGGRAWVKMVVEPPRNPNNQGDDVALDLLGELREGALYAERNTGDAVYYAEPIKAKAVCMYCHGEPKGAPDPYFPQFTKDGWQDGDVIGADVARVGAAGQ